MSKQISKYEFSYNLNDEKIIYHVGEYKNPNLTKAYKELEDMFNTNEKITQFGWKKIKEK